MISKIVPLLFLAARPALADDLGETLGYVKSIFGDDVVPADLMDSIEENESEALTILIMKQTHGRDPFESTGTQQLGIDSIRTFINEAAEETGLPPALIDAIIRTESGYRPQAVSRKGARGLMQIMPSVALELRVENVFSPRENIMAGSRYLKKLLDRFQNVRLAIAAYNAGPEAVKRYKGIPPYPETRLYVQTVLRRIVNSALVRPRDELLVKDQENDIRVAGEGLNDPPKSENRERNKDFDMIIR